MNSGAYDSDYLPSIGRAALRSRGYAALIGKLVLSFMMINTPRTRLRCWEQADRDAFAAMHADREVMHDYGGPISRGESDAKLDRYVAAYREHGFCRWAVETREGAFLGYAGIMPSRPGHPLGSHTEIGWRLVRHAWGYGYATEAARAALTDAFVRVGLAVVVAYAAPDNLRSQAVMTRLQMQRDPSRDFTEDYRTIKAWQGLVWEARRVGWTPATKSLSL